MSRKILIVEDDENSRFMLSEMLEDMGYDMVVAEDGQDGVDQVVRHAGDFALILMDIHMPVMTGVQAVAQIRAMVEDPPRSLPIIAVSADSDWQSKEKVKPYGFDSAVSKPVRFAALKSELEAYA